jgi:hypothetical protein
MIRLHARDIPLIYLKSTVKFSVMKVLQTNTPTHINCKSNFTMHTKIKMQ